MRWRSGTPVRRRGSGVTRIWVDADGCPMKVQVYRVARRHGLAVTLVANHRSQKPGWVAMEVVEAAGVPDAADRHILARGEAGDLVVTDDLPLARACLDAGMRPVSNRGRVFAEGSVQGWEGGPEPFDRQDRSAFRRALEGMVVKGV